MEIRKSQANIRISVCFEPLDCYPQDLGLVVEDKLNFHVQVHVYAG